MEIIEKRLGCALFLPKVVKDLRGEFDVPFSIKELDSLELSFKQVYQLNHSFTNKKGTIRGLNFQNPYPQAKVIRCIRGSLYSVGVCLEGTDKGKYVGYILTEDGKEEMYIPHGYAHGFVTLEDNTELEYITDNRYCFEAAKSIKWDSLGIDWSVGGKVEIRKELLSDKNKFASVLKV